MALTSFNTKIQELALMQSSWGALLNPLLANPVLNGIILSNVSLAIGDNMISHKLDRKLIGWQIIRLRGPATIYDKQDSVERPNQFLKLNSNAIVKIDLYVF